MALQSILSSGFNMFGLQKTIKSKVSCVGIGLHSGADIRLTIFPAGVDHGIVFRRTDVQDKNPEVKACYTQVSDTKLGTTLANEQGVTVATVEHLMAAFWGCGIDNCLIEINGPEIPIMDGSSAPFMFLLECAGIEKQGKYRQVIEVLETVSVNEEVENGASLTITPHTHFVVDMKIDFNNTVIAQQKGIFDANVTSFKSELCRARTFGFAHEVEYLRENGLARGGSLDNAIVVDTQDGILNKEGLRYTDEFVRHKILDCIGDVYLAGKYVKGKLQGIKSGHTLNYTLLKKLFSTTRAWQLITPALGMDEASLLKAG